MRAFGFDIACFAAGARWGLDKVNFFGQYGPLFDSIDIYGGRKTIFRGTGYPPDSSSWAIWDAFQATEGTDNNELARF